VCHLHQCSRQTPHQATLKPMQEFRPMAVLHADLAGPLLEVRISWNKCGFQYILSVMDSATCCLWLLPIRHKTAGAVAATLSDKVISQVSVPSAILTDRKGELMGGCRVSLQVVGTYPPQNISLSSSYRCHVNACSFPRHNRLQSLLATSMNGCQTS